MKNSYIEENIRELSSKIESQIRESLEEKIKKEYEDKINLIEIENHNLKIWNNEYKTQIKSLEYLRKMKISDLMDKCLKEIYFSDSEYVYDKKCNKCDNERHVHFKSPSGKDMEERCECAESSGVKLIPKKHFVELYRFTKMKDSEKITMYYRPMTSDEDSYEEYNIFRDCTVIDNKKDLNMVIETGIGYYYFIDIDFCKKYCDSINKKNGITDKMKTEEEWAKQ